MGRLCLKVRGGTRWCDAPCSAGAPRGPELRLLSVITPGAARQIRTGCRAQKLIMQQPGKCGVTHPTQVPRRSFDMLAAGYSDSDVLMVKSAQDRQGEDTPYPLGVTPDRRVWNQQCIEQTTPPADCVVCNFSNCYWKRRRHTRTRAYCGEAPRRIGA